MIPTIGSYLCLGAIGYLDYLSGYDVHFGSIYLLCVAWATWCQRPRESAVFTLLTTMVWITANWSSQREFIRPWVFFWNTTNLFGSLAITAAAITAIRITLRKQLHLIRELRLMALDTGHLRRLLPVCRTCRQLRTDPDYIDTLSEYLEDASSSNLVGGICADCLRERNERVADMPIDSYFHSGSL